MARVAGVNIPDKKQAWISLTHIFGIGRTTALKICETTGIKFDTKISALNEQELEKLRKEVGNFLVEGDLRREVSTNIKRLMDLGTLRGIRHRKSIPQVSILESLIKIESGVINITATNARRDPFCCEDNRFTLLTHSKRF